MIITQTPYRVSFSGGGTDFPAYYKQEFGAVLSVTIRQYMYVAVHRRFEPGYRISYSHTETVNTVEEIRHDLVREAIKLSDITDPLEITTIGDVPSGTGMGSSSSLAVGLLEAFCAYRRVSIPKSVLGSLAAKLELEILGKPIGKQDHYAATFGGLNYITFLPDGKVVVHPVHCTCSTAQELERQSLLFFTGKTRDSSEILEKQSNGIDGVRKSLTRMRDIAKEMLWALISADQLDEFAKLLRESWEIKKSLGFGISNRNIDEWYNRALKEGAKGGKLLGAGGGGFLYLMAPPERHNAIREALGSPLELPFRFSTIGTRCVLNVD